MFDQYRDRVVVVEIDANEPVDDVVDIALYDSFAQPESDRDEINLLVHSPRARQVVVYTWNFHPELINSALQRGARGYLSKTPWLGPRPGNSCCVTCVTCVTTGIAYGGRHHQAGAEDNGQEGGEGSRQED